MTESISFKNIINLIKLDFFRNRKSYLYLLLGLFLITIIVFSLTTTITAENISINNDSINELFPIKFLFYLLAPFLWLTVLTSNSFVEYKTEKLQSYYLQIPITPNEKFIAKLIIYFICIPLLVLLSILIGETLVLSIYNKIHLAVYGKPNIKIGWITNSTYFLANLVQALYLFISAFFCAALFFSKNIFIKSFITIAVIIFISVIISTFKIWLGLKYDNEKSIPFLLSFMNLFKTSDVAGKFKYFNYVLLSIPFLLVAVSYFKFKEIEA